MTSNTTSSEIELMQQIYESDYDAVKILYNKYSPLLYTLIKKILKEEKLAEEVLADIFFITQKRINYFDFNTRNPYTWLVTLAKNRSVFELRKKNSRIENFSGEMKTEFVIPRLSYLTDSLDLEKAIEMKANVEDALNKLTDAQQYVIYLAYYEGLTQQEIAEKLKIPFTTVEIKIRNSLINLNENFKGKSSLFTVKNEIVEMIYPFVLGCLDYKEQLKVYDRFKTSEPFPWKLLGEYQNLVSLLPVILEFENPSEEVQNRILNYILHLKSREEKAKSFEQVSSTSLNNIIREEAASKEKFERVVNFTEKEVPEKKEKSKADEFEPVIPFKPSAEKKENEYAAENEKRNYTSLLVIGLIVIFVITAVMAYLFYQDRTLYYETQIEILTGRIETMINEIQNRPEIPGLNELKNPQTIDLANVNGAISSGRIIFSYTDKRGYLHIRNLPILDSDNAYQLWGKFNRDFISLGVFKVSSRPDYYPFTLPEFIHQGPVEFYLIESNAEGSRKPGSKVYLRGNAE